MKNILLIEPWLPYPLASGGHQAIYNGIRCMNDMGNLYLTYICPEDRYDAKIISEFEKKIGNIKVYPYKKKVQPQPSIMMRGIRKGLRMTGVIPTYPTPDPFSSLYRSPQFSLAYLEHIQHLIDKFSIDIVQIEMPPLLSLVCALPDKVKKVYVHHEIQFVRNQLSLQSAGSNLYREMAVSINKEMEMALLNKYDAVITLSEVDKDKLIENGVTVPVHSSIAVVDTDIEYEEKSFRPGVLTFVGYGPHKPNGIGLQWFLDICWNKLLDKDTNFCLHIIGKWDDSVKKEISEKYRNVKFLGFVPDLYDALSGTTMIVPITIGSGIRMKILEAASMKVPFVTTSVGVEGLPFTSGKECFIADTPEDFIEGIMKLKDEKLRHDFTERARTFVKKSYSLDALRKNRQAIYREL